ncbi:hypothetical protein HDU84_004953 [Entophlyctis sp. JEL0112]|nr:hypothetical protein HDU84_004953 [Entophlyctis sp. JEL0112]
MSRSSSLSSTPPPHRLIKHVVTVSDFYERGSCDVEAGDGAPVPSTSAPLAISRGAPENNSNEDGLTSSFTALPVSRNGEASKYFKVKRSTSSLSRQGDSPTKQAHGSFANLVSSDSTSSNSVAPSTSLDFTASPTLPRLVSNKQVSALTLGLSTGPKKNRSRSRLASERTDSHSQLFSSKENFEDSSDANSNGISTDGNGFIEGNTDSDSDDDGAQMFVTTLSVQIPNQTTQQRHPQNFPSMINSQKSYTRVSSNASTALIGSPRPYLRVNCEPNSRGSSSQLTRPPSTLIDTSRKFSYPGASIRQAPSDLRGAARASTAVPPSSLSESWRAVGSLGSFQRYLSGVSVKRRDSTVSSRSGTGFADVAVQSPAMSYLSMLSDNMTGTPRGVYSEGDQISDWVLGKEIGSGTFSRVFEAYPAAESQLSQVLDSKVAIKIVAKKPSARESDAAKLSTHAAVSSGDVDDVARLLEREIEIWSILDHPNILTMIQTMDVEDAVFVVSELAEGGTLLDYVMRNGKIPEAFAKKMFRQVAEAVLYLHTIVAIVHRDIKCENILIIESVPPQDQRSEWVPTIKLADFGLSEKISNVAESPRTLLSSEPIFCVGSIHYCAPEELRGSLSLTTSGDLWSLGVVLYVMLAGALPFNDDYLPRLELAIKSGNYDEGRLCKANISDSGMDLVRRLLCVDVSSRLTIEQLVDHEFFS